MGGKRYLFSSTMEPHGNTRYLPTVYIAFCKQQCMYVVCTYIKCILIFSRGESCQIYDMMYVQAQAMYIFVFRFLSVCTARYVHTYTSMAEVARAVAGTEKETASFQTGLFVFFRADVFFFFIRFPFAMRQTLTQGSGSRDRNN